MQNDPDNYECAANGNCSGNKPVCLEGNGQSVCFDCSKVETTCAQYWYDDAILQGIKDKCNKTCKFNTKCSNNPTTTDKCNNHTKKCGSRVQQDSDTNFWHACMSVDKNKKPCTVNDSAGWCDPRENNMWAP